MNFPTGFTFRRSSKWTRLTKTKLANWLSGLTGTAITIRVWIASKLPDFHSKMKQGMISSILANNEGGIVRSTAVSMVNDCSCWKGFTKSFFGSHPMQSRNLPVVKQLPVVSNRLFDSHATSWWSVVRSAARLIPKSRFAILTHRGEWRTALGLKESA